MTIKFAESTLFFYLNTYTQNWAAAERELRNFGDDFPTRRGLEADLLRDDPGTNSCEEEEEESSEETGAGTGARIVRGRKKRSPLMFY